MKVLPADGVERAARETSEAELLRSLLPLASAWPVLVVRSRPSLDTAIEPCAFRLCGAEEENLAAAPRRVPA
jgi:hypothetical protein